MSDRTNPRNENRMVVAYKKMGQRMKGRLLVAKDLAGQEQQQRIVADETKPQAAMKGGE